MCTAAQAVGAGGFPAGSAAANSPGGLAPVQRDSAVTEETKRTCAFPPSNLHPLYVSFLVFVLHDGQKKGIAELSSQHGRLSTADDSASHSRRMKAHTSILDPVCFRRKPGREAHVSTLDPAPAA